MHSADQFKPINDSLPAILYGTLYYSLFCFWSYSFPILRISFLFSMQLYILDYFVHEEYMTST